MKLIDKDAVLAEIKKIYNEDYKFLPSDIAEKIQDFKDDVLMNLDVLQVKEVDLEKEILKEWRKHAHYHSDFHNYVVQVTLEGYQDIAEHFFELGLKAQKGE